MPRTTATVPTPPRVSWAELGPEFLRSWGRPRGKAQPEHVSIYGPTGSGKSYLEKHLLMSRAAARGSHVVIVATKPADETLRSTGWPIVKSWPPGYGKDQVIFWARAKGLERGGLAEQRRAVAGLLDALWTPDANTIVAFDELAYLEQDLALKPQITRYYREGRALGLTIVATTQRPAGVSRYMHSEAGWTMAFGPKDEDDRDRIAQVLGRRGFRDVLDSLDRSKREFLMIREVTREVYITHLPNMRTVRDLSSRSAVRSPR